LKAEEMKICDKFWENHTTEDVLSKKLVDNDSLLLNLTFPFA